MVGFSLEVGVPLVVTLVVRGHPGCLQHTSWCGGPRIQGAHHLGWIKQCRFTEMFNTFDGILPKGPYLPCVSMAGRALLAGYHRIEANTKWPPFSRRHLYGLPWMKMYELWLKFHWSLFLEVQLTIFQHWLRLNGFAPTRQQAIIWTNDG